jgi:hypothetical protein
MGDPMRQLSNPGSSYGKLEEAGKEINSPWTIK